MISVHRHAEHLWDEFSQRHRRGFDLARLPGMKMFLDFRKLHTMFQDTGATTPAAVGQVVKLVRDPLWNLGRPYSLSQGTTANAPTLVNVDTGITGVQFDSTDRLSENTVGQPELDFFRNKSSVSVISVAVLPAAAVSKRIYYASRNASASTRASGLLAATNIYQHQSRRLDADSAQLFGSGAVTYTTGDRVIRIDDYDYTKSNPLTNVWTWVNGAQVISGSAAWGAGSATSNTASTELVLGGTLAGDPFTDGILIAFGIISPRLPACIRSLVNYQAQREFYI